jgi:dTMP kinase
LFITFEGIEGCGKTTQAIRLMAHLKEASIPSILTREPGGTRVGEHIRHILLDSENRNLTPLAELMLYAADRAQHVTEVIKPALEQGKWVVCDRFFDATVVYQGCARGQDIALIRALNDKTSYGLRPDITFLIDCPVKVGLKRALARNKMLLEVDQERFEREKTAFHEAVRSAYLSMARDEHERFVVLDGTLQEDKLEEAIFGHIQPFIAKKAV